MTWEQKLEALESLSGFVTASLRMRAPGNWYVVLQGLYIQYPWYQLLSGGDGDSPAAAVENTWKRCVEELPPNCALVLHMYLNGEPKRMYYHWNGCRWASLPEDWFGCQSSQQATYRPNLGRSGEGVVG